MTLLVGFGAVNTGNNLLYLLLGMMLAIIIVSGMLSESVLQKLEVTRRLPERIFEYQAAPIELSVENQKVRSPSFSIQVQDKIVGVAEEQRPAVYVMRVDAEQTARQHYRYTFRRRGRFHFEGYEVATRFPFDLFKKSREFSGEDSVIVYPKPDVTSALRSISDLPFGEIPRNTAGPGEEFFGLRDYRTGDDQRNIAWKVFARSDKLVTLEYEREDARTVTLCFPNIWPEGQADTSVYRAELERAIRTTAGLAKVLLGRGYGVGFATMDTVLSEGRGPGQLNRILHELALLHFYGDPRTKLKQPRQRLPEDRRYLVVGHGSSLSLMPVPHRVGELAVEGGVRDEVAL